MVTRDTRRCGDCDVPLEQDRLSFSICFTCNFWLEKVILALHPEVVRIGGSHYQIGSPAWSRSPAYMRGLNGRKFTIRFTYGREIETNNLWHQGMIPIRFRHQLPDNAVFVEQSATQEAHNG